MWINRKIDESDLERVKVRDKGAEDDDYESLCY